MGHPPCCNVRVHHLRREQRQLQETPRRRNYAHRREMSGHPRQTGQERLSPRPPLFPAPGSRLPAPGSRLLASGSWLLAPTVTSRDMIQTGRQTDLRTSDRGVTDRDVTSSSVSDDAHSVAQKCDVVSVKIVQNRDDKELSDPSLFTLRHRYCFSRKVGRTEGSQTFNF